MINSSCRISFYRNDLQKTKLWAGKCPIKNCSIDVENCRVPFQKRDNVMQYLAFCPEHGIRIHKDGFVYYNGQTDEDLALATKRNLMFHSNYYVENFLKKGNKMESGRLCFESSEDAVSYNVFTEMLYNGATLKKLVGHITKENITDEVELYLWGGKINLKDNKFLLYEPLLQVRKHLEHKVRRFATEPDIMLIVPSKIIICIEAKFGSKNPIAIEKKTKGGEKPKSKKELIKTYCLDNKIIDASEIFDFSKMPSLFYEQIFRNIVFAASIAKLSAIPKWYVLNLRNQHTMNLKRGRLESMPILRNIRSMLRPKYKKRFNHITWEQIYDIAVKGNENLYDLSWYFKNKSLNCGRAFNVL